MSINYYRLIRRLEDPFESDCQEWLANRVIEKEEDLQRKLEKDEQIKLMYSLKFKTYKWKRALHYALLGRKVG